jgi:hypothetical protein
MRYSNPILALSLLLAFASAGQAMTTYTEQWMSGDTVYATASTDSDFESEVASATLVIYGPSGTSASVGWGDWYYACVQTSLQLTTEGEHHAYSTHYTQSIAAIAISIPFDMILDVVTNFQYDGGANNVCVYVQDCPGAGGGSTRLCSHVATTKFVTVPSSMFPHCATGYRYLGLRHAMAVRFAPVANWTCIWERDPLHEFLGSQPNECTQKQ